VGTHRFAQNPNELEKTEEDLSHNRNLTRSLITSGQNAVGNLTRSFIT